MQPIKMRSRLFARCEVCREERPFLASGDRGVLFGPNWLCVSCYFGFVSHRARSSVAFEEVSAEEVGAKMAMITNGHFNRTADETEKGRCVRLLALEQLRPFAESEQVRKAIADDLGLSPGSLFPWSYEESGGYDSRKDAVISLVRASQASQDVELRASLLAKTFCVVLGAIVVFMLYRAWK
jgi:hypothetical protein